MLFCILFIVLQNHAEYLPCEYCFVNLLIFLFNYLYFPRSFQKLWDYIHQGVSLTDCATKVITYPVQRLHLNPVIYLYFQYQQYRQMKSISQTHWNSILKDFPRKISLKGIRTPIYLLVLDQGCVLVSSIWSWCL